MATENISVPPFDPANFVRGIDNPYLPLTPGVTYFSESPDGAENDAFKVTHKTKTILGVTCIVVEHTAYEDGEIVEIALDYFAQDKDGNVWYFGEFVRNFVDGKVVNNDGTWLSGVDGAAPGIFMLANPQVGDEYDQENAPGIAEDHAKIVDLDAPVNVPYGASGPALKTEETTPLEPDLLENKFYVQGIGQVVDTNPETGELLRLVKIRFDGTNRNDKLTGNIGKDELFGFFGDDELNGAAGADTIYGGNGKDLLNGGSDNLADLLYGENGNDKIHVGRADQAFGGNGDDLFLLGNVRQFGSIDGGEQNNDSLRWSRGDILQFDGTLNLTAPGISERIHDIETLSMKDGQGNDRLVLNAQDVLNLGDGEYNPWLPKGDQFGEGNAVRIDGDAGDTLRLAGGWQAIEPSNEPEGYEVFACKVAGGNVYALVQEDVSASLA